MAKNMAQRRSQKAARRKMVLAQRHRATARDDALPSRIRRAATGPVHHCVLSEALFETGMGTLTVARGAPGETMLCSFLLDTYCSGVKDVQTHAVTLDEAANFIDLIGASAPVRDVEPAYACKLLRDLTAWAEAIGFPPPPDLAVAQRIFGDVSPDGCDDVFTFGKDGKPTYMPGPTDTLAVTRRRLGQLQERLGKDGFDFVVEMPSGLQLEANFDEDADTDDVFEVEGVAGNDTARLSPP